MSDRIKTALVEWSEIEHGMTAVEVDRMTDDYNGACDVILAVVPAGSGDTLLGDVDETLNG